MLIGEPGSRLKTCEQCGMQWTHLWLHHFAPERIFRKQDYKVELCPDCKERYDKYVKQHIRKDRWDECGVKEKNE